MARKQRFDVDKSETERGTVEYLMAKVQFRPLPYPTL
jgi:hypothetical protein